MTMLKRLLKRHDIDLVLVDVGASIEVYPPFRPLIGAVTYVAFDPDSREYSHAFQETDGTVFLDRAVTAAPDSETVRLFLTRNPTCSSTLRPNSLLTDKYLFAHRFEVVAEESVPAISLELMLEERGLERLSWLKLDTQGTDLRIVRSLSPSTMDRVMALDLEPGLESFYLGEDTFARTHDELRQRGFWLSDIRVVHAVRMSGSTLDRLYRPRTRLSRLLYEFGLKQSPVAVGPRYLRKVETLDEREAPESEYLQLWACAVASGNTPYALDVLCRCREIFGETPAFPELIKYTMRRASLLTWPALRRILRKVRWSALGRLLFKDY